VLQGIVVEMVAKNWKHWLVAKMLMGLGQGLAQQGILTVSWRVDMRPQLKSVVCLGDISHPGPGHTYYHVCDGPVFAGCSWPLSYGWSYALGQLFVSIALQIVEVVSKRLHHTIVPN
jgi:hypothetical protein